MKKTSLSYLSILIAAIAFSQSCAESVQPTDNGTTVVTSSFSGAEGNCTNGGIKLELSHYGEVQPYQTQYICHGDNGANGQDGQTGADGKDGQNGVDGKKASIQTTAFTGEQGSCTSGGVKIDILIDGVVQTDQAQYICNGANGADGKDGQNGANGADGKDGANGADGKDGQTGHNALVATSDEVGTHCATGGMRIDIGLDANDNGTLDTAEILSTRYVCNGANGQDGENGADGKNTSIKTSAFTGAQGTCTNGGVKVDVLIDGVVQTDQTQYICNGANGADGKDGQNGADGKDGQNGADGKDGQNGADGQNGHNALVATSDEVGANCATGGMRIDIGLDANDNGTLDTAEILSTRYVCNGTNGQDGANGADGQDGQNGADGKDGKDGADGKNASIQTTAFTGAQGSCTNGGVKVDILIDGVVQADQTQYICNGANGADGKDGQDGQNGADGKDGQNGADGKDGADGQNGHNALVATSDEVGTNCANGGMRIDIGLDANDNGSLDTAEIITTRYVCNGTNGQDGANGADGQDGQNGADGKDGQNGADGKNAIIQTTAFTGEQGSCTNGGVKVDILIDGVVQADQTQYICNGANGAHGAHWLMCYDSSFIVDSRSDSANCGGCGNVCAAGFECVNSTCQRIADMSTATITCNAQIITPYSDPNHCSGCNNACDLKTCKAGMCVTPAVGDHISFGHYEQDGYKNGKESIEWRVLEIKDGKALIISEKTLDVQPYNTTEIHVTWEKSTIRSWLNGYDATENTEKKDFTTDNFIDTAFTEAEKAWIIASNVPAHRNPSYLTSPGNDTTDRIFLLSVTEANNYFKDNADRTADATRYAVKQGAQVKGSSSGKISYGGSCTDAHCYSIWWLRSPGRENTIAAYVSYSGEAGSGNYVETGYYAVRPALWVNL